MKPIIQNILVCLASSLVALTIFVCIVLCIHKTNVRHESKTLNEKVLTYFEKNDIPYKQKDSNKYIFTYNKMQHLFLINPEDPEYLHIVSVWSMDLTDHCTLLEIANDLAQKVKFIKIAVTDDNDVVFSIEQLIDKDADIDESLSRWLNVIGASVTDFFEKSAELH